MFAFPVSPDGSLPAFVSTDPQQVRHALSVKEGWWQFVQRKVSRPKAMTVRQLNALDDAKQQQYNLRRQEFHRSLVIVHHDQLNTAWEQMREVAIGQWADDGPGMGVALSGGPGFGKTAATIGFLRLYERELRAAYPSAAAQENEFVPVVYSSLLRGGGLKAQMRHILRFYGHPVSRSATGPDLADELIGVLNACSTRILCLDQAQNLHVGNRKDEEVAAVLKDIMDQARTTLILVGIDIDTTGPLAVAASGRVQQSNDRLQLARRFALVKMQRLARESVQWRDLLASIETQLVLAKAQPGDLSQGLADDIWNASNGAIGVAFNVLRVTANRAITDGSERITRQTFRGTVRTIEAARKRETAA
jgi:hypothetical protein